MIGDNNPVISFESIRKGPVPEEDDTIPIPYSPVLENHVFPNRDRIMAGVREVLQARRSAAAA